MVLSVSICKWLIIRIQNLIPLNIRQQTLTHLYLNKYINGPVYSMSEPRSDSVHWTDARNKLNQQNMFCFNQDLCHALWNLLHSWLEVCFSTLSKQHPFLTSLNCYQSCSHQLTICSCWCCCSCNVSWAMVLSRLLSSTLSTCTSLISSSIWKHRHSVLQARRLSLKKKKKESKTQTRTCDAVASSVSTGTSGEELVSSSCKQTYKDVSR